MKYIKLASLTLTKRKIKLSKAQKQSIVQLYQIIHFPTRIQK